MTKIVHKVEGLQKELDELFYFARSLDVDYSPSSKIENEEEGQHELAVEQEQENKPVLNEKEEEHDPEIEEEVEEQIEAPEEEELGESTPPGSATRSKKRKASSFKGKSSKRAREREENKEESSRLDEFN